MRSMDRPVFEPLPGMRTTFVVEAGTRDLDWHDDLCVQYTDDLRIRGDLLRAAPDLQPEDAGKLLARGQALEPRPSGPPDQPDQQDGDRPVPAGNGQRPITGVRERLHAADHGDAEP